MSNTIPTKSENDFDEKAELIRKKYVYRRLIMKKKTALSHASAVGLIGPDSAYHLYRHMSDQRQPGTSEDAE